MDRRARARLRLAGANVALVVALAAGAKGAVFVRAAFAAEPTSGKAPQLTLTASAVFGSEAVRNDGWFEIAVRIDNPSPTAKRGNLVLVRDPRAHTSDMPPETRVPFQVSGNGSALLRIPTHGLPTYEPSVSVRAVADDETETSLGAAEVLLSGSSNPVLVDVANPSRLAAVLRGSSLARGWEPYSGTPSTSRVLTVGAPTFEPKTGDPVLPTRATSYSPATVVLIASDLLAHLESEPRDALIGWVMSGGTLAIVPRRAEDLRNDVVSDLVGGIVHATRDAASLEAVTSQLLPPPFAEEPAKATASDVDEDEPAASPAEPPTEASASLQKRFTGYVGGTLAASAFGATTAYGQGEVHLLAFDPAEREALEDPWVKARMLALVERAWNHRVRDVFLHGGGGDRQGSTSEIRRALDPNEGFRPPLAIAAVLLVIYSILVGPVLFLRAARMKAPFAPLVHTPILSAATFALVVLVGFVGKGFRGRARHLALVEAAEGSSRGVIRRYRGFFASRAEALSIRATDGTSALDLVSTDSRVATQGSGTLRVDRDGLTLEGLTALPWQNVVVREDGLLDLGRGISLRPSEGGELSIENRTGHEIRDAVVFAPRVGLVYFETLAPDSKAFARDGRLFRKAAARTTKRAGTLTVHTLSTSSLDTEIAGGAGHRLEDAWRPFEAAASDAVDWFPDDTPVLIGELIGGDPTATDSGLRVESNRVFVRIVANTENIVDVTP
jgi:hypothetical protein